MQISYFIIYTMVTTVRLVAFPMEDCDYKVHGVCIDRWYQVVSCLPLHFDMLFDCSKGHIHRQSLRQLSGHESFYTVFNKKENKGLTLGRGGGGQLYDVKQIDFLTTPCINDIYRPLLGTTAYFEDFTDPRQLCYPRVSPLGRPSNL